MNLTDLKFKDKFEILELQFNPAPASPLGIWNLYEHKDHKGIHIATSEDAKLLTLFIYRNASSFTIDHKKIWRHGIYFTFQNLKDVYRFIHQFHPTLN